jgi:hypothetical protein
VDASKANSNSVLNFTTKMPTNSTSHFEPIQIQPELDQGDLVKFEAASREWTEEILMVEAVNRGMAQIKVRIENFEGFQSILYFQLRQQSRPKTANQQTMELWLAGELAKANGQKVRIASAKLIIKFTHPPPPPPPQFDQPRIQLRLRAPVPAQKTLIRVTAR